MIAPPSRSRLLTTLLVLGATAAGFSSYRACSASAACRVTERLNAEGSRLVDQIDALRRSHQFLSIDGPPESDLSPRVLVAMASSGLAAELLKSVRQTSDTMLVSGDISGGTDVHARTVDAVIEPLTMSALGSMLHAWHAEQPAWPITGIELTPIDGSARLISARLRFTCTFSMRAMRPTASERSP